MDPKNIMTHIKKGYVKAEKEKREKLRNKKAEFERALYELQVMIAWSKVNNGT